MRSRSPSGLALIAAIVLALAGGARAAEPAPVAPATETEARRVHDIAAELRCVVCQALSVADSTSTTAQQMRAIILDQVRAGKSRDEILAYFVSRYGEWVLLAPPRRGFNLLAWWLPFAGIAVGTLAVVLAARRWVANGRKLGGAPAPSAEPGATSPLPAREPAGGPPSSKDRARLADELARLGR